MSSQPGTDLRALRYVDLPIRPGARIRIQHSPGDAEFAPAGPGPHTGDLAWTVNLNGELWRAAFRSSSIGPEGAFLELEIEGRYPDQGTV